MIRPRTVPAWHPIARGVLLMVDRPWWRSDRVIARPAEVYASLTRARQLPSSHRLQPLRLLRTGECQHAFVARSRRPWTEDYFCVRCGIEASGDPTPLSWATVRPIEAPRGTQNPTTVRRAWLGWNVIDTRLTIDQMPIHHPGVGDRPGIGGGIPDIGLRVGDHLVPYLSTEAAWPSHIDRSYRFGGHSYQMTYRGLVVVDHEHTYDSGGMSSGGMSSGGAER